MPSFLNLVAKDLAARYVGDSISEVTLVFPSRRAGLFFSRYLSEQISKPIWMPKIVTINELMQQITGLSVDDPIRLITKLFEVYNRVRGVNETFENFYFWGEVLLADFDQVDKYRVDTKQLFTNIKDIKEIDERFGGLTPEQTEALRDYIGVVASNQISELKQKYLSVWGVLFDIYSQFKAVIEKDNLAYEGMIYRKAADLLGDKNAPLALPNPIAYVGFNALNQCEKSLLLYCKRECNGLFYWDYDPLFVDNKNHEAGQFIRENLLLFPNALSANDLKSESSTSKVFKMVAAPSVVAQTKLVPKILDQMRADGARFDTSTAIIFPKENILLPTLQSIPSYVEQLNITIGYPLKETPAFSLMEFLVRLQINANTNSLHQVKFYHNDVVSVLNHPYIRLCDTINSSELMQTIKRHNRIYPTSELLSVSPFLEKIFKKVGNDQSVLTYLITICNHIALAINNKLNDNENQNLRIELEFLYSLYKSLNRLSGVIGELDIEVTSRTLLQILRKAFTQERVSFTGEPLAGMQMMGFLESRALDFENIIILSFNDDVLPGKNHPVSFITPSLRIAFGLPDHKHRDAVYAYYFYRLLNRAKRVYLVYSSRAEGLSSGEKSRYGLQLEMEQMVGEIETIPVEYDLSLYPSAPISISKSADVLNLLVKNLAKREKGLAISPSALTAYITCPLRFYFHYLARIRETDEIAEEIGALEFGKIIHNTMEALYANFNSKTVTPKMVRTIISDSASIEKTLDKVFCLEFLKEDDISKAENLSGRNLLARNAMLFTIKKMLNLDMNRAPFYLVNHEQEIYVSVPLNSTELVGSILLGGFVDRIEINNDAVWAIDYKTGKYDDYKGKFKSIEDLFDPTKVDKCKEVFQTFCYSLALTNIYPNKQIKPALWFVKVAKDVSDFSIKHSRDKKVNIVEDFRDYLPEFSASLSALLTEIFDHQIPFTQTTDTTKCKNCSFVGICGRD